MYMHMCMCVYGTVQPKRELGKPTVDMFNLYPSHIS